MQAFLVAGRRREAQIESHKGNMIMSRSSAETRPVQRAAGNAIVILFALLLAVLSMTVPDSFGSKSEPSPAAAANASTGEAPIEVTAPQKTSLFLSDGNGVQQRAYHPSFETSDSAGALGFWMLVSLCGLFLSAGLAPALFGTLRHPRR